MKRTVCVITGSRADYGLLRPLIEKIASDKRLQLQLIATGMHLSGEFGNTYREIQKDGFRIDTRIDIRLTSDSPKGVLGSMALALTGFAKAFGDMAPDIIVVLGDRFEIFGAVIAAHVNRILVAHISGGERTEGVLDDSFRHSITKMSHVHFTSTDEYRKRVIQLGERPERVFNVGAIGLDIIKRIKFLSRAELEKRLGFTFGRRNVLVTFHPVTLERGTSEKQIGNLLKVLDGLKDTKIVFTKANADTDNRIINKTIAEYVSRNPEKAALRASLGHLQYLSAMRFMDAVVGNSSSGIVEAPSLKIGTINIGDRQKGRIRAKSVIDCEPTVLSIAKAFRRLYSKSFQDMLGGVVNPYQGGGYASERIVKELARIDLPRILKKSFFDLSSIQQQRGAL